MAPKKRKHSELSNSEGSDDDIPLLCDSESDSSSKSNEDDQHDGACSENEKMEVKKDIESKQNYKLCMC